MRDELSHDLLRFLDRIEIESFLKSKHWLSGRHPSQIKGDSPEFKEYRNLRPGESYRHIDWKSSARQTRWLVREREHHGTLEHWIIMDNSGSMDFPEGDHNKHRRQQFLCGLLLYLIQSQGDPFSLAHDGPNGVVTTEPSRGPQALHRVIGWISECQSFPGPQRTDFLDEVAKVIRRPSQLWIISDWDREPRGYLEKLSSLQRQGHDLRSLYIVHPSETELPGDGLTHIEDLEGQHPELSVHIEQLRTAYREQVQQHRQTIIEGCRSSGIDLSIIDVSREPEHWLDAIFSLATVH